MVTILGADGRPMMMAEAKTAAVIPSDLSRWFPNGIPSYNPDDLIRSKARGLATYRDMMRDPHVASSLDTLKAGVTQRNYQFAPAGEDDLDIEIADFVRDCFEQMDVPFIQFLDDLLDAVTDGYAILEPVYRIVVKGRWAGKAMPLKFAPKPAADYDLVLDEFWQVQGIRSTGLFGKTYLPEEFCIFSFLPQYGNPYGRSILRRAYRAFFSKDVLYKFRNLYLERFGNPLTVGKHPVNIGASDRQIFEDALKAILSKTVLTLRSDFEVDFVKAAQSHSEYKEAMDSMTEEIVHAILGATLGTIEGEHQSRAAATVHRETNLVHSEKLAWQVAFYLDRVIIPLIVNLNYADVESYPTTEFEDHSRELTDVRESLRTAKEIGLPIAKREAYHLLGLTEPDGDEDVLLPPPAPRIPDGWGDGRVLDPALDPDPASMDMAESTRKFWRAPTRIERMAEVERVDDVLRIYVANALVGSQTVYDAIKADMIKQVERAARASQRVEPVPRLNVNADGVRAHMLRTLISSHLIGRTQALRHARNEGFRDEVVSRFAESDPQSGPKREDGIYLVPVEPEQAARYFRGLTPMRRREFDALVAKLQKQAFTIAGIEKSSILAEAQRILLDITTRGGSLATFRTRIDEMFASYARPIWERRGTLPAKLSDHHAENVFRTNIQRSYNEGRVAAYSAPEVKEFFPAFQFSSILDDRTTSTCREKDGFVARRDDPVWQQLTPPLHYQCRSMLIAVSVDALGGEVPLSTDADRRRAIKTDTQFGDVLPGSREPFA